MTTKIERDEDNVRLGCWRYAIGVTDDLFRDSWPQEGTKGAGRGGIEVGRQRSGAGTQLNVQ